MKDTCLEGAGMIKVAKNFTQQLNLELYTLEAQTLIAEIKLMKRVNQSRYRPGVAQRFPGS